MTYTLAGDRGIEYGFLKRKLPKGNYVSLDVGCGPDARSSQIAIGNGHFVVGVDIEQTAFKHGNFMFIKNDVRRMESCMYFDWIMNVSSIEHFGLAGRYGVEEDEVDADLEGMRRLRELMKPDGKMILTFPMGEDFVVHPLHRIYGRIRVPHLIDGFVIEAAEFYAKKDGRDIYVPVELKTAIATSPGIDPSYYALGCMLLSKKA